MQGYDRLPRNDADAAQTCRLLTRADPAHRYNGRCPMHAGGRHALSCLPYDVFDADLGEFRLRGRPSSV